MDGIVVDAVGADVDANDSMSVAGAEDDDQGRRKWRCPSFLDLG